MEEQASRLEQMKWEVYNKPFIVMNEDLNVTPIYQSVDKIPKQLRDFQQRVFKKNFIEYD